MTPRERREVLNMMEELNDQMDVAHACLVRAHQEKDNLSAQAFAVQKALYEAFIETCEDVIENDTLDIL